MTRVPRCLVESLDAPPHLDEATFHHMGRVLRLRQGDVVELVDGLGGRGRALWTGDQRPAVQEIFAREPPDPEPLWIAVGPPRPSRLDWLVEKAAELGVAKLHLLQTQHAVREVGSARVERLQRKADEAMLQCRRLHRMVVQAPLGLDALLEQVGEAELWTAEPPAGDAPAEPGSVTWPARTGGAPLLVVVGPEGGLHPDESAALRAAGARSVGLGTGILRVETAVLAIAARLAR